ncbi:hypothetical protein WR164_15630 [Philodulcilactobacillus myokoensis]|uniref:Serine aminopeptidase S33 domain-containing protein n=1 Tax=Philodulcilactobacillus myokoensis TaxID=2929573 RepID=A0A9W6B275_9LACO|nr:alpha/beta fold hydrolase [Philodulcilactobacillus myokoensis]GLB47584.1 hypothetical protein WR164_15630 [Philodulcilactobacillus myokoensis]
MIMNTFETKRDHLTIRGRIYQSQPKSGKRVIIICHGYGSDMISASRYAKSIVEPGFDAIVFDFCGSGNHRCKSDGDYQNNSVLTEIADLKQIVRYVQSLNYQEIDLMGCSQGGYVAGVTAGQMPDVFQHLVLFYPGYCIQDDMNDGHVKITDKNLTNLPWGKYNVHYIPLGQKYVDDAKDFDIWKIIGNFKKPVLICHGTSDHIVNIKYSQKAMQIYQNAELFKILGADHVFHGADQEMAMKKVNQFLK